MYIFGDWDFHGKTGANLLAANFAPYFHSSSYKHIKKRLYKEEEKILEGRDGCKISFVLFYPLVQS